MNLNQQQYWMTMILLLMLLILSNNHQYDQLENNIHRYMFQMKLSHLLLLMMMPWYDGVAFVGFTKLLAFKERYWLWL